MRMDFKVKIYYQSSDIDWCNPFSLRKHQTALQNGTGYMQIRRDVGVILSVIYKIRGNAHSDHLQTDE